MSELNDKLQQILDIKNEIKNSIEAKGGTVSDFASYSSAGEEEPEEPEGEEPEE